MSIEADQVVVQIIRLDGIVTEFLHFPATDLERSLKELAESEDPKVFLPDPIDRGKNMPADEMYERIQPFLQLVVACQKMASEYIEEEENEA